MASGPSFRPSFSRSRKWGLGFNAVLASFMVLAVIIMVNYLAARYFRERFYLSTRTQIELSSRTVHLLRSLTNHILITLYYDKTEPLYGDIAELLKEYHAQNSDITVETVDYDRDPGAAELLKAKYNYDLGAATNKNLVIFDCGGKVITVPGNALAEYTLEPVPNATEREFRRKPVAFKGEMMFTAALLAVTNPKPLRAYFLQGHDEHRVDDGTDQMGYLKLVTVLQQNHIKVEPLSLLTNAVPADCNLLVIAGPKNPIPEIELDRIEQYVNEGGRLLVLFNFLSTDRVTGLEKMLAGWGIQATSDIIKDPEFTTSGSDVLVIDFGQNPAVNPLVGSQLQLILPREIKKGELPLRDADATKVEEIAFSGPRSYLNKENNGTQNRHRYPLIVAMERSAVKGVGADRGTTRILTVGDSIFLANVKIDSGANRDFAGFAVNWLLDRSLLLEGLGPRPVNEWRLLLSQRQQQALQWILLGAIPGGILLFGGLVWLRRRN